MEHQFDDLTTRQQQDAKARFFDAAPGDGYWYMFTSAGSVLSRNRQAQGVHVKWKVEKWLGGFPEPVEVIAETTHFVTVREKGFAIAGPDKFYERRMKKDGTIYDTFAAAKAAMVENAKMRVEHAEAEWQRCKDWLKKCNDMKAPAAPQAGSNRA